MTNPMFEPFQHQPAVADLPTTTYGQLPQFTPEPPPAAAPGPKRSKTGVVILSIVMVLFLGAAGAFGFLYFTEKQHSKQVSEQLAAKDRELTDVSKKAKDDLGKAQDAQKKAEDGQKRAEGEATANAKCKEAARTFREAVRSNDEQKGRKAIEDVFVSC